jgi:hypothetical protein
MIESERSAINFQPPLLELAIQLFKRTYFMLLLAS